MMHQLSQPVSADVRPGRVIGHGDLKRLDRTRWPPPRRGGFLWPLSRCFLCGVPDPAVRAERVVQPRGKVRRHRLVAVEHLRQVAGVTRHGTGKAAQRHAALAHQPSYFAGKVGHSRVPIAPGVDLRAGGPAFGRPQDNSSRLRSVRA
jgi:hypothetical protein